MLPELFLAVSLATPLPPKLLESVCYVESTHRPNAVRLEWNLRRSLGLCQIQLRTARSVGFEGTEKDLLNPTTNAIVAAKILKTLIDRCKSVDSAILAYNSGKCDSKHNHRYLKKVKDYMQRGVK